MRLEGLHHVTAITGDAPRNLDFYTGVLGLRLAAKTVNQDDPGVYHLFYADELGRAGSELTFFEYPGAIPGRAGAGMVHRIVWRVGSAEALAFWAERLRASRSRDGDVLRFADPEGLEHELVVSTGGRRAAARRAPRDPGRARAAGLRRACAPTRATPSTAGALLEDVLGARPAGDDDVGAARRAAVARTIAYDPRAGRARPPERRQRPPRRVGHDRRRAPALGGAPARGRRAVDAGSSTATTSTRSTSASRAACSSRSPTTGPASRSTSRSRSWARSVILPPRLEPQRAEIEARLTPLPDPVRAG